MSFLELSFELGSRDPDAAEAVCFLLGALAVTFSDQRDDAVLEPAPGEVRLWPATRVQALFAANLHSARVTGNIASMLTIDSTRIGSRTVEDRAWEREWLKDFHATRFGRRLWVCPHHESVDAQDAVVVRLDPGLAFGTGTHASTALCLAWLDGKLTADSLVIDYGCGSGVLGIAAARLGASEVWCHDIDPQALTAARENAEANTVAERVHVVPLPTQLPARCDVLLANILASTLCERAPAFAALVRAGGQAVLSGLLERDVPEVTRAYSAWFDIERFATREHWVCLAASRKADA